MFAIPFLHKLVRYLPVAVVLAAFIWGFGHAGYPQQPFYIRGVEVGIGGVALGLVMLRWGILPTLVWHYSLDAGYTALLLVRSHNLYFRLSGAASAGIVVLPLLVALVAYWWRGGFEPEGGLLNADESAAVEEPAEAAPAGPSGPGCHHGVPAAHQPRAPGGHRDLRGRSAQPADSGEPFRRIAEIQNPGRAGARGGGRVPQAAGSGRRRLSSLDLPGHALERRRQSGGQVFSGAAAGECRLQALRAVSAGPALDDALFQIAGSGRSHRIGASGNRQGAGIHAHHSRRPPRRGHSGGSSAPDRLRLCRGRGMGPGRHGLEGELIGEEESAARLHAGVGGASPATLATWTKPTTACTSKWPGTASLRCGRTGKSRKPTSAAASGRTRSRSRCWRCASGRLRRPWSMRSGC